jgi:hypothetical protein
MSVSIRLLRILLKISDLRGGAAERRGERDPVFPKGGRSS